MDRALVADIRLEFLQKEIDSLHRDYLQFMWYENMENPNLINIYFFSRLAFGWRKDSNFETVLRDLYVDDTATSFNSSSEALEF